MSRLTDRPFSRVAQAADGRCGGHVQCQKATKGRLKRAVPRQLQRHVGRPMRETSFRLPASTHDDRRLLRASRGLDSPVRPLEPCR